MEGTVNIVDFMQHLQRNNLVIAPAHLVEKDYSIAQKKLLKKTMATYKEIADSGIWGNITKERVSQLATEFGRDNEVVKCVRIKGSGSSVIKVTRAAIVRIAKMRGLNTCEL